MYIINYLTKTNNKMSTTQTNYWEERFNNLPNYIVVGEDMDGITGYTVIHKKDEKQWRSGSYHMSIMNGLSMVKSEMQKLADEMNSKEEAN